MQSRQGNEFQDEPAGPNSDVRVALETREKVIRDQRGREGAKQMEVLFLGFY